jgi:hypothetical protein
MEWAHKILLSVTDDFVDQFRSIGIVEALASIFKVCFVIFVYTCNCILPLCRVIFSVAA